MSDTFDRVTTGIAVVGMVLVSLWALVSGNLLWIILVAAFWGLALRAWRADQGVKWLTAWDKAALVIMAIIAGAGFIWPSGDEDPVDMRIGAMIMAAIAGALVSGFGALFAGPRGARGSFVYIERRVTAGGNREGQGRAERPRLEEEPEEIDWPQWEAAPPEAPALSHEEKLSRYTRENGLKAVQRANVNPDRAASTAHAQHLIRYCEHVLGSRARGFIASAAKDTGLPENVRRLYIHAAQIAGRE